MIESKTFIVDENFNINKLVNNLVLYINANRKVLCEWTDVQNGYFIQVVPKYTLKKLFGLELCLHLHISKLQNKLIVNIGIGEWIKEHSSYLSEITPCFNIIDWHNKPTIKKILLFIQNYVSTNIDISNIKTKMSINSNNYYDIKCNICNHINPPSSMFCLTCGNKLHTECYVCGSLLQLPSKICPKCGKEN